jgi:hypothetical protein
VSGWTNDIPAHLSRPRDQGVIDAPRVQVDSGPSSWENSGKHGVFSAPIKAGGTRLHVDAAVTVPDGVVIQCAPAAPAGLLANVKPVAWDGESFGAEWRRLRGGK